MMRNRNGRRIRSKEPMGQMEGRTIKRMIKSMIKKKERKLQ